MKTRPVGAELFHADRHDEAIVAVCNFADAPKNALKAQKCSLIPPPLAEVCHTVTQVRDMYAYVFIGTIL